MKVITSKIFKGKKMFLIDDENYQDGGVIEDNQGQWKYPGQITKINSPNITMKGVNYPVLGISNTGHKQLMMPEQEYTFDGQSVTEYPITAQAGTTVKVNKDNVVKEYDRRSPEYKAMYDSGKLMSYDKTTDTYTATPLQTQVVKTNAPQWLLDKRKIEQNYTKEKFVKKSLPKWANSVGETADNLSENAQKDYEKKVNDKLANIILKRNPKLGKSTEDRLKWAESLTEKERDIVNRSSYANKFLPAMNAYNENQSNLTKNYSTRALLLDADKLAQSVEGTPERFRLFPNAENNVESYINPGVLLGQMAKGLGNVPKDIKEGNNLKAALSIANPIGFGALAGIGNPSTGQFVNNLANPLAGTGDLAKNVLREGVDLIHPVGRQLRKINKEGLAQGLSPEAIKRKQMDEVGITSLQRKGYFPGASEIATEYITPYKYSDAKKRILDIPKRIVKGEKNSKYLSDDIGAVAINQTQANAYAPLISSSRYDAWRMYSGMPQKNNTFRIAETSPVNHPSYTQKQLNELEKFSLNNEESLLMDLPNEFDYYKYELMDNTSLLDDVTRLQTDLQDINDLQKRGIDFPVSDFGATNVMALKTELTIGIFNCV